MGLFSFLKNAGAKLFGKKAEKNEEEVKIDRIIALKEAVLGLGLPITDFDVDIEGDNVKVFGTVESQEVREKVILTSSAMLRVLQQLLTRSMLLFLNLKLYSMKSKAEIHYLKFQKCIMVML